MKKIYKILILPTICIYLYSGCSTPNAFTFFKKDELKANAIQYTRKSQITKEGEVKAILNATYLNSVDKDFDDENENFIIGVYISNDNKKEKNKYLNNKKYTLSMNDREDIYRKELSKKHKMYGHIPLYNKWGKYYLIKYDKKEDESSLKLTLFSEDYNASAVINFEAE